MQYLDPPEPTALLGFQLRTYIKSWFWYGGGIGLDEREVEQSRNPGLD